MNVEELAKERDNLFPKEIAGYKRPDAFLDKSNDFFDELPLSLIHISEPTRP